MAGNWTRWPKTGQLTSLICQKWHNLFSTWGRQPISVHFKVSKWTVSCRKMRKLPCINKKLGRLQTKVAGNWATYCTWSLLSRSDRHIDVSKDIKDRKDTLGYEAMVNWIFLSRSGVQTAKNYQKIDRRLCWFRHFHTFKRTLELIEMAGKPTEPGTLCGKPLIDVLDGGPGYGQQLSQQTMIILSFNSLVKKMRKTLIPKTPSENIT